MVCNQDSMITDNEVEAHTSDAYSIPTKPSLAARNSANRNSSKRKVPPIAVGGGRGAGARDDVMQRTSARDNGVEDDYDGVYDDDSDEVS